MTHRSPELRRRRGPFLIVVGLLLAVAVVVVVSITRGGSKTSSGDTAGGPATQVRSEPTTPPTPEPTTPPTPEPTPEPSQRPPRGRDEKPPQIAALPPTSVRISSVGINSDVVRLQMRDGLMELPDNPRDAGWLTESVPPGQPGVSIVVGVGAAGGPGVFARLGALRQGDGVSVERRDQSTADFVVTRTAEFADEDFPTRVMRGSTPRPTLRLITAGPFDRGAQASGNVIAYARLVERRDGR